MTTGKYRNNPLAKGIGFYGEQTIPGSTGNSIVVVYNNTSHIGIQYKIVKHGTLEEQPVILSFISTDIDAAQGVQTNLANLVELIPPKSNLTKDQYNIIYDTTPGVVGLNGSSDIPRGSYLGAGFLSQFDYVFYSPAPERMNKSYAYPFSVRYDMFGSSLQANVLLQVYQHITVNYEDTNGNVLKTAEYYKGFTDKSYTFDKLKINGYRIVDVKKDISDINYPRLTFVYAPVYPVTFQFVDEQGNTLIENETYTYIDKQHIEYTSSELEGYMTPAGFSQEINGKVLHVFVYRKINKAVNNTVPPKLVITRNASHTATWLPVNEDYGIKRVTVKDPFLENTGMSADEKQLFLNYIKEVGRQSRVKHGNDIRKINHDIANAIAYATYNKSFDLQTIVNEFGEKPEGLTQKVEELVEDLHRKSKYIIDMPHLAAPLATKEDSGFVKEALKFIAGYSGHSLWWGNLPDHNFFQLNSLTGDILSEIDQKDRRTDLDALILNYHPNFKDLPLDKRIEQYYHTDNLNEKREFLYQEILNLQSGGTVDPHEQEFLNIVGSTLSLGGLAFGMMALVKASRREGKKLIKDPLGYMGELLVNTGKAGLNIIVDPVGNVVKPVVNGAVTLIGGGLNLVYILGKKVYNGIIKPGIKRGIDMAKNAIVTVANKVTQTVLLLNLLDRVYKEQKRILLNQLYT